MSNKAGSAWMGSSYPGGVIVPRDPGLYDGEIDLGFGAALRMAATIVTRDPIFGWFTYGGMMEEVGNGLALIPRDGIRRRFDVVIPDIGPPSAESVKRVKLELEQGGFAAERPIVLDKRADRIEFTVENRTGMAHATTLKLSFPPGSSYTVAQDGRPVSLRRVDDWDYPWRADLPMRGPTTRIEVIRE